MRPTANLPSPTAQRPGPTRPLRPTSPTPEAVPQPWRDGGGQWRPHCDPRDPIHNRPPAQDNHHARNRRQVNRYPVVKSDLDAIYRQLSIINEKFEASEREVKQRFVALQRNYDTVLVKHEALEVAAHDLKTRYVKMQAETKELRDGSTKLQNELDEAYASIVDLQEEINELKRTTKPRDQYVRCMAEMDNVEEENYAVDDNGERVKDDKGHIEDEVVGKANDSREEPLLKFPSLEAPPSVPISTDITQKSQSDSKPKLGSEESRASTPAILVEEGSDDYSAPNVFLPSLPPPEYPYDLPRSVPSASNTVQIGTKENNQEAVEGTDLNGRDQSSTHHVVPPSSSSTYRSPECSRKQYLDASDGDEESINMRKNSELHEEKKEWADSEDSYQSNEKGGDCGSDCDKTSCFAEQSHASQTAATGGRRKEPQQTDYYDQMRKENGDAVNCGSTQCVQNLDSGLEDYSRSFASSASDSAVQPPTSTYADSAFTPLSRVSLPESRVPLSESGSPSSMAAEVKEAKIKLESVGCGLPEETFDHAWLEGCDWQAPFSSDTRCIDATYTYTFIAVAVSDCNNPANIGVLHFDDAPRVGRSCNLEAVSRIAQYHTIQGEVVHLRFLSNNDGLVALTSDGKVHLLAGVQNIFYPLDEKYFPARWFEVHPQFQSVIAIVNSDGVLLIDVTETERCGRHTGSKGDNASDEEMPNSELVTEKEELESEMRLESDSYVNFNSKYDFNAKSDENADFERPADGSTSTKSCVTKTLRSRCIAKLAAQDAVGVAFSTKIGTVAVLTQRSIDIYRVDGQFTAALIAKHDILGNALKPSVTTLRFLSHQGGFDRSAVLSACPKHVVTIYRLTETDQGGLERIRIIPVPQAANLLDFSTPPAGDSAALFGTHHRVELLKLPYDNSICTQPTVLWTLLEMNGHVRSLVATRDGRFVIALDSVGNMRFCRLKYSKKR